MPHRLLLHALLLLFLGGTAIACSSYGFANHGGPSSPDSPVLYVELLRSAPDLDLDMTAQRRLLIDALHRQGIATGSHNASYLLRCSVDSQRPLTTDTQIVAQADLECTLLSRHSPPQPTHPLQARGSAICSISSGSLATQALHAESRARQQAVLDGIDQIANLTALTLTSSPEGEHE